MTKFLIKGGRALEGEIEINGSKNAALPVLASSVLFKEKIEIENLPNIEDVKRMQELLDKLDADGRIDYEIAKKFRASILPVGAALARFGKVAFPHPGGCVIGERPIDVFLDGWKIMGAKTKLSKSAPADYEITAPEGLFGVDYTFKIPSVTGTEALIMTAVLAKGTTILRNAVLEPEIKYLADFLNANGAQIAGAGTTTIKIEGRSGKLLNYSTRFIVPPDRIEAGSFAILGALLGKNLRIKNFVAGELSTFLVLLFNVGVEYVLENNSIIFPAKGWSAFGGKDAYKKTLRASNVTTKEFPGFPTDLQAPFTILLTQADGISIIHETVYENRFDYAKDLNFLFAHQSPKPIRTKNAHILRFSLEFRNVRRIIIVPALLNILYQKQIERGYENIDYRLRSIGADIKQI
ncbi:MAG: UDP-N-acetylglucosamine 1-carboxyvinyltransferase [Candidatus Giovannonibacteria bacterium GW2011_GWC2_44_9]|uniref:UDP-N-acetylglucosamine 1-carboxyvinyltransferase n=1 Tax=Candidatus Giovannonibacteria bacterium GW2011_GWC2_44_9 TaxID=1618658 RepID=A0A0G1KI05_9BACT|nr:MAG: UDP-N-acetylglucosamine 1-carboxyvinyltransferase [Candidatus Giovannonibacteria bacterium GW2011_GWC2_44_9]